MNQTIFITVAMVLSAVVVAGGIQRDIKHAKQAKESRKLRVVK
jgi:outer membrane murein-binding lipoprotein Lpp